MIPQAQLPYVPLAQRDPDQEFEDDPLLEPTGAVEPIAAGALVAQDWQASVLEAGVRHRFQLRKLQHVLGLLVQRGGRLERIAKVGHGAGLGVLEGHRDGAQFADHEMAKGTDRAADPLPMPAHKAPDLGNAEDVGPSRRAADNVGEVAQVEPQTARRRGQRRGPQTHVTLRHVGLPAGLDIGRPRGWGTP